MSSMPRFPRQNITSLSHKKKDPPFSELIDFSRAVFFRLFRVVVSIDLGGILLGGFMDFSCENHAEKRMAGKRNARYEDMVQFFNPFPFAVIFLGST